MAKRDDDLEFSVNAAFDEERAVVDKVPLYLVNGSLGAGKTSVLEFLLQQSDYKGARVIENEYANENVDGYRLEGLAEMVTTLAGDCVCCSSKHALTRMLLDFCRNSPAPVFIEAAGVARTMNLVEKLINAQIFNKYELMQSFYVIDAHEILRGIEPAHEIELQAADVILVTKEDLLNDRERDEYEAKRRALPYAKVLSAPHGQFDLSKIITPSGLLAFFDTYDGELAVPDNPTYAVLDVSGMNISAMALENMWPELFRAYGLRRMKGCFISDSGVRQHVEATEQQIQLTSARPEEAAKIVLIGERADEITRDILQMQLMMFE
ncbi:GTP-binding protein [Candidatus Nanosynbacter lyticus]|uniref:GTP-binding protein n=1 Tax=Candidatus Nanosynbacter lyticus TaxID=2093824 RepID=UPI00255496C7|nr:GTP-binding protein [Candidatus Nanosynbacter lyticus]WLD46678.1 hypothetical protein NLML1_0297 [Candidatus Nanosynbacter lyticus]